MVSRQRTTIIIPKVDEASFHSDIVLKDQSITFPEFDYQRQDRFTISIDTLSEDWRLFLSNCRSFRFQYSDNENYDHSIFSDFAQSGLNINFVPNENYDLELREQLKSIAQALTTFTGSNITDRSFILTPTSIKYFQLNIVKDIISKNIDRDLVSSGIQPEWKFIQLDYDPSKSEDIVLEIYWDHYNRLETMSMSKDIKKEVGVFSTDDKLTNIENTGLNGVRFLFTGSKIEPKKTSFQFTPRQMIAPKLSFNSSLLDPTGLHPTYSLQINNATEILPPLVISADDQLEKTDVCKLYSVWNIPKEFFLDKYQLRDEKIQEKGINLLGLFGDSNLELPSYLMENWGTEAIIELEPSSTTSFEIPMHLRYSDPSTKDYTLAQLQHPLLFWACDLLLPINVLEKLGEVEGGKNRYQAEISQFESTLLVLSKSPFHQKFLDYESYFDDNTIFYQIQRFGNNTLEADIPVANIEDAQYVQLYTAAFVLLSILYLLRKIYR